MLQIPMPPHDDQKASAAMGVLISDPEFPMAKMMWEAKKENERRDFERENPELFEAMTGPIDISPEMGEIGRKMLMVDELPQGPTNRLLRSLGVDVNDPEAVEEHWAE